MTMIIEGKRIAHELKGRIREKSLSLSNRLSLAIIVAKETVQIRQFVEKKEKFGSDVGVRVEVIELDFFEQKNEKLLEHMLHAARRHDGVVVQLPIPREFSIEMVMKLYPMSHDVDVIGDTSFQQFKEGNLPFLPPVVGAFAEILRRNSIKLVGKNITILGEGRLVGSPAAIWAEHSGGKVTVATKGTVDLAEVTKQADVIISGTGVPGLIQPDMVKEGVIILDAGSGEMAGAVKGDADPGCSEKTKLFTPTPGGVGPITVAKVFENLLALHELKERNKK